MTDDGLLTLHEEECIGVCDHAPAVQVDLCNHDEMTPARMRELVAGNARGRGPRARARAGVPASFRRSRGRSPGLEARAGAVTLSSSRS